MEFSGVQTSGMWWHFYVLHILSKLGRLVHKVGFVKTAVPIIVIWFRRSKRPSDLSFIVDSNFAKTSHLKEPKLPTSNVQWIVCTDGLAFTSHCRQTVSPFRIRSPSNVEDIFKLTEGRSEKERLIRSENSQKLLTIAKNEGQTLFSSSAKAQVWKM